MKKVLHIGIDPPEPKEGQQILHCPLIEVVARPSTQDDITDAFQEMPAYTHLIFTSKNSVRITLEKLLDFGWNRSILKDKQCIAVGKSTADLLETHGCHDILIPSLETAEGIAELMDILPLDNCDLLWPHSALSRPVLSTYFKSRSLKYKECILYDTISRKPTVLPNMNDIDEIVFTSSSSVDAYISIFEALPKDKILTSIGPITQAKLDSKLQI